MKSGGYRPLDVSGYNTKSGDVRYTAVWEKSTSGPKWRIHRDVSRAGMQALVDAYEPTGWTPVRVEGHRLEGDLRFSIAAPPRAGAAGRQVPRMPWPPRSTPG